MVPTHVPHHLSPLSLFPSSPSLTTPSPPTQLPLPLPQHSHGLFPPLYFCISKKIFMEYLLPSTMVKQDKYFSTYSHSPFVTISSKYRVLKINPDSYSNFDEWGSGKRWRSTCLVLQRWMTIDTPWRFSLRYGSIGEERGRGWVGGEGGGWGVAGEGDRGESWWGIIWVGVQEMRWT